MNGRCNDSIRSYDYDYGVSSSQSSINPANSCSFVVVPHAQQCMIRCFLSGGCHWLAAFRGVRYSTVLVSYSRVVERGGHGISILSSKNHSHWLTSLMGGFRLSSRLCYGGNSNIQRDVSKRLHQHYLWSPLQVAFSDVCQLAAMQ